MPTYTIVPGSDGHGYRIDVVGENGARHTMLGFDTEAEAEQWIEADKRREKVQQATSLLDAEE
jgi:antibiotic biosynthesis monooxygenase (ABM) superfamily enzyme